MSKPKNKTEKGKVKRAANPKPCADGAPHDPFPQKPSNERKSVLVNDEIPLGPQMEGGVDTGKGESKTVLCVMPSIADPKLKEELRDCQERLKWARSLYFGTNERWRSHVCGLIAQNYIKNRRTFWRGVAVGVISSIAAIAVLTGLVLLLK